MLHRMWRMSPRENLFLNPMESFPSIQYNLVIPESILLMGLNVSQDLKK